MKPRAWMWILAVSSFAALAITVQLTAQDNPNHKPRHHQYKLYDVGNFGGNNTFLYTGPPSFHNLNSRGIPTGHSETTVSDPYSVCWIGNCLVAHAFKYQNNTLVDLGALPGVNSSIGASINNSGVVAGISENGSVDPLTGYPETRAVVWNRNGITDLGTLGGNVSDADAINERGQVVGSAANAVPDPYAAGIGPCFHINCFPVATQQRAFLWQQGAMRDLGTLGGNDAAAGLINNGGQVAGVSYTNTTANQTTGLPTQDPFFWQNGKMVDIGTLGGTYGYPWSMNERGQVVGQSNLAGDVYYHAFLWDRGVLSDLGTLGGHYSGAFCVSNNGRVTGYSFLTGDVLNGYPNYRGVLWKNGHMIDLGALPGLPRSVGVSINSNEQIVGDSASPDFSVVHASLWEDGGPMVDLNALVSNDSGVTLEVAWVINEQGEILVSGAEPNGDASVFVLVPDGDCNSTCESRIAASQSAPPVPAVNKQEPRGMMLGGPGLGRGVNPFPGLPFRPTANKQR